jgi:hypothetical protein
MIKIDKDIPPPEGAIYEVKRKNSGPKSKFRLGEMELGDSIFLPGDTANYILTVKSKNFMETKEGRNRHFAVASVDGGARCWLVGIDNDI